LRLKLLNDKVDKFILVESKQTHSGIPKPAFFEQNKELFDEYSDKIINIVIDEFPSKMIYSPSEIDVPENLHIHWFRENFQRNEILKGLYKLGLNKNDVILISDLDEIPDPNKLDDFIEMIPEDDYCFQLQKWCIWDFDRFYNGLWPGTAGVRWETLLKSTPQEIRKNRYSENKQHTKEPFGWHCSWFGGTDAVMDKLRSFAHQELREMSREDVETKMTMNLDIHGHQLIYDKEGYRPLI
jgi:beta-1,4-mannosyl-glycoprotein beta-1,4-N-acetylglucosaminyltransferase